MEIQKNRGNNETILHLQGRLDSNTAPAFEQALYGEIHQPAARIILDFADLDYISSAGLRVILKGTKDLKRSEGMLVLCALQDYVREVFEIAGFDTFLAIESDVEAARKRLQDNTGLGRNKNLEP